jgi:uracil-DNA glycosylase
MLPLQTSPHVFDLGLELAIGQLRELKKSGRNDLRASAALLQRIRELRQKPIPGATDFDPSGRTKVRPSLAASLSETTDVVQVATEWAELQAEVLACQKCPHLAASRNKVVFGVGNPKAELMFVGEAPGADEDLQGEPFVGRAGELLTKIIQAMGFRRSEVYIANVLKCRPDLPPGTSGNRPPTPEEMETCLPYLRRQIELIKPKVMVALGGVAMRGLFGKSEPMKNLRGRWHQFGLIPVMATFHPSYLLRNQAPTEKRKVWEDMLQVLARLGHPITERQRQFFLAKS